MAVGSNQQVNGGVEMTPNDIEILIHCHVSPTIHPRAGATGVKAALRSMERNGLIEELDGFRYTTTSRGKAHIEQMCRLKWPVEAWVGADGKIIET